MIRTRISAATTLAALLLPTVVVAQQTTGAAAVPVAAPTVVPIHTQAADEGVPYGLWAAGAHYKASFHDGFTFVPYLGADYPFTQSVAWRTESAKLGELELCTTAPELRHDAHRASYDLGGLTEVYDVRSEGVEQTFVLTERPAAGALVIRGRVQSAMRATDRAAAHAPVTFRDHRGVELVEYGAAVAIDARGHKQPMTTSVAGDALTLVLDANWLASAELPVVVDPLFAVFLAQAGDEVVELDLMRDTALLYGNLWHATSRAASASDLDLYVRRTNDDGSNTVDIFVDLNTTWSTIEPSIGMHAASGLALVAFTRDFDGNGFRKIRYHEHSRYDNFQQNHFTAINTDPDNAWRPDVAHDLNPVSAGGLLVVFQREDTGVFANVAASEIVGCTIALPSAVAGPQFVIAQSLVEDMERPVIGKRQAGDAAEWTVAWQVIGVGAPFSPHIDWDIEVRKVDVNGPLGTSHAVAFVAQATHQMAPRLTGFGDSQRIVYTASLVSDAGPKPMGENGHLIYSRNIQWNGAVPTFLGSSALQSDADARLVLLGFDVDRDTGDHAFLTFRSTVTNNVYFRTLGYNGMWTDYGTVFAAPAGNTVSGGAVVYDLAANRFVIAYGRNPAGGGSIELRSYEYETAPAPTLGGLGCGSGTLAWDGLQLIGSASSGVTMTNAPAGALMTVLVGTAPFSAVLNGIPPIVNGCWLLVPNVGPDALGFLPGAIGPNHSWTLPLPESLDPLTIYFQGVHFDATNTQVYTTQRLTVPIVK